VRHGNYDVQTIQTDHLRVPRRVTRRLVDNKVEAEGHRNYCISVPLCAGARVILGPWFLA
jgi:hypothetical protein